MAEFKEGQGVKTHRDNDVSVKLVDGASGATATDILSIVGEGDTIVANTNDYGIPAMFRKADGTYVIPGVDGNGNQIVSIQEEDKEHGYHLHDSVAAAATDDHDIVVTSAKKVKEIELFLSGPGCTRWDIGEFDGTSTFDIRATFYTQPANPNLCCKVCLPEITGDGSIALRVRATNKDDTANDSFSTMCFIERD